VHRRRFPCDHWRYISAEQQLAAHTQQGENYKHAEDAALAYAVNAAQMNYKDLGGWKAKLVAGTSPELKDKLSKAADSMEQILVPLQWDSTAKPLVAKVRSESGGIYVIDAFVSVLTKTAQAPEGLQSTATYSITMDQNQNWQITDVGGVEAVVGSG
jgi:Mce-associated membrane protein